MEGCWVDLLSSGTDVSGKRSPLKRQIFVPSSPSKRVAIHESTPLAPRRLENGRTVPQVDLLRSQLASLVQEKLTTGDNLQRGGEGVSDVGVEGLRSELREAQSGLQRRDEVISKLTGDNTRLVQQLEQLWQRVHHSRGTLSPLLSPEQSFTGYTPPTKDMSSTSLDANSHVEVQSLRDALDHVTKEKRGLEVLCRQLKLTVDTLKEKEGTSSVGSASEPPPVALEEKLLEAKRLLVEERVKCHQLEQRLESVEGEKSEREQEEGGRWEALKGEIRLLKLRMEQAIKERTNELNESLDECDRLHTEKAQLMKEKDLLATSLRQEAVYTRHLEEEKATEEGQLDELRHVMNKVADELEVERSRRTSLGEDYERLMAEYQHLQGELQGHISSSANVISELQGQLAQSNSKVTNQIKVTKEMESQLAELHSESEQLQSSLSVEREKSEVMQGERVELEAELASLRAECDKLREGLAGLKEFSDQRLQQEVDSLKAELERKEVELSRSCDSHMTSCDATLDELESVRTANLLLQQEVSDLKLSLALTNQDVTEKNRLLDEMKHQLEAEASMPDEEVDLGEKGQTLQLMQEECTRLTREVDALKLAQSDSVSVHQQLRDANEVANKLRHSLNVAKAGKAELEGSGQALKHVVTVLTMEVKSLKESRARLEEEAAIREKRVESLLALNTSLQKKTNQLADECSGLREALQVAEGEGPQRRGGAGLERVDGDSVLLTRLTQQEKDLSTFKCLAHSLQRELQEAKVDGEQVAKELVSAREEVALLRGVLSNECTSLRYLTQQQERSIAGLLGESVRVAEGKQLVESVCTAQDMAVKEREESISRLMAEVGALRSRHSVLTGYLEEQELSTGERLSEAEISRLRAAMEEEKSVLRQLIGQLSDEKRCLQKERDALQAEVEQLSKRVQVLEGGCEGDVPRVSTVSLRGCVSRGVQANRKGVEKRQLNYLRTKLGYALTELRLYKKLKEDTDVQISELQMGLESTKQEHQRCLQLLNTALAHELH